ncbi:hypothetical protein Tcan_17290 [Toxocara canis]|uniref:Uncharacterized protein n=1 Tax=Toxocara canis TaxID=6265 RepID=A0A0B2VDR4_TOXCA|nr:hypothetical protein Tcan_17290 [Toxocara canis]
MNKGPTNNVGGDGSQPNDFSKDDKIATNDNMNNGPTNNAGRDGSKPNDSSRADEITTNDNVDKEFTKDIGGEASKPDDSGNADEIATNDIMDKRPTENVGGEGSKPNDFSGADEIATNDNMSKGPTNNVGGDGSKPNDSSRADSATTNDNMIKHPTKSVGGNGSELIDFSTADVTATNHNMMEFPEEESGPTDLTMAGETLSVEKIDRHPTEDGDSEGNKLNEFTLADMIATDDNSSKYSTEGNVSMVVGLVSNDNLEEYGTEYVAWTSEKLVKYNASTIPDVDAGVSSTLSERKRVSDSDGFSANGISENDVGTKEYSPINVVGPSKDGNADAFGRPDDFSAARWVTTGEPPKVNAEVALSQGGKENVGGMSEPMIDVGGAGHENNAHPTASVVAAISMEKEFSEEGHSPRSTSANDNVAENNSEEHPTADIMTNSSRDEHLNSQSNDFAISMELGTESKGEGIPGGGALKMSSIAGKENVESRPILTDEIGTIEGTSEKHITTDVLVTSSAKRESNEGSLPNHVAITDETETSEKRRTDLNAHDIAVSTTQGVENGGNHPNQYATADVNNEEQTAIEMRTNSSEAEVGNVKYQTSETDAATTDAGGNSAAYSTKDKVAATSQINGGKEVTNIATPDGSYKDDQRRGTGMHPVQATGTAQANSPEMGSSSAPKVGDVLTLGQNLFAIYSTIDGKTASILTDTASLVKLDHWKSSTRGSSETTTNASNVVNRVAITKLSITNTTGRDDMLSSLTPVAVSRAGGSDSSIIVGRPISEAGRYSEAVLATSKITYSNNQTLRMDGFEGATGIEKTATLPTAAHNETPSIEDITNTQKDTVGVEAVNRISSSEALRVTVGNSPESSGHYQGQPSSLDKRPNHPIGDVRLTLDQNDHSEKALASQTSKADEYKKWTVTAIADRDRITIRSNSEKDFIFDASQEATRTPHLEEGKNSSKSATVNEDISTTYGNNHFEQKTQKSVDIKLETDTALRSTYGRSKHNTQIHLESERTSTNDVPMHNNVISEGYVNYSVVPTEIIDYPSLSASKTLFSSKNGHNVEGMPKSTVYTKGFHSNKNDSKTSYESFQLTSETSETSREESSSMHRKYSLITSILNHDSHSESSLSRRANSKTSSPTQTLDYFTKSSWGLMHFIMPTSTTSWNKASNSDSEFDGSEGRLSSANIEQLTTSKHSSTPEQTNNQIFLDGKTNDCTQNGQCGLDTTKPDPLHTGSPTSDHIQNTRRNCTAVGQCSVEANVTSTVSFATSPVTGSVSAKQDSTRNCELPGQCAKVTRQESTTSQRKGDLNNTDGYLPNESGAQHQSTTVSTGTGSRDSKFSRSKENDILEDTRLPDSGQHSYVSERSEKLVISSTKPVHVSVTSDFESESFKTSPSVDKIDDQGHISLEALLNSQSSSHILQLSHPSTFSAKQETNENTSKGNRLDGANIAATILAEKHSTRSKPAMHHSPLVSYATELSLPSSFVNLDHKRTTTAKHGGTYALITNEVDRRVSTTGYVTNKMATINNTMTAHYREATHIDPLHTVAASNAILLCPQPLVNLSHTNLPLPDDIHLIGDQPIGTTIVHVCANNYIFKSSKQPVNVYVCLENDYKNKRTDN